MKFPALCLLLLIPSLLFSKDYYVSLTGNDSNPGTLNSPFQSILRGVVAARLPGDNIIIRQGTYNLVRTILLNQSGLAGRLITLKSLPREKVILDGSNLPVERSIIGIAGSHIVVEGLELRKSPRVGVAVFGPGNRINNIAIRNNIIRDCVGAGIFTGFNLKNQGPYAVLIEGNQVFNNVLMNEPRKASSRWAQGISTGLGRQVTVRNNRVSGNYGEGIGFYLSDQCIAEGNTVYDNFSVDIYLDNATNCKVIGNRVYSTGNPQYFRFKVLSNGIMIANEEYNYPDKVSSLNPSINNLIANNIVSGHNHSFCYGNFQKGGGLIDTQIVNNTFYGSVGEQFRIDGDQHRNTLVANNLIYHTNPRKQIAFVREPSAGITYANNAWFGGIVSRLVRGKGDLNADPKLVDPTKGDFRLTRNSPCIDKGMPIRSKDFPKVDFSQTPRSARIDIGAYEFTRNR